MSLERETFIAQPHNLPRISEFVEGGAERGGLDGKRIIELLIALEEAFVNICSYAYPQGEGEVEIACGLDGDAFVLELADSGIPFDILALPEPDTTLDVMEREVGGLGVYFIRQFTDEVSYRREEGRNILRLVLRRSGGDTPS